MLEVLYSAPLPNNTRASDQIRVPDADKDLRLDSVLPTSAAYFYYNGSVSRPPCTQNVEWFVFQNATYMSADTLARFRNAMYSVDNAFTGNCRKAQVLNGRKFYFYNGEEPGRDNSSMLLLLIAVPLLSVMIACTIMANIVTFRRRSDSIPKYLAEEQMRDMELSLVEIQEGPEGFQAVSVSTEPKKK